jgi:hypothetical protein
MPRTNTLRHFGKTSPPKSEYTKDFAEKKEVNEAKLCDFCGKRNRRALDRLCEPCGRRYYHWGTCDERFVAFRLDKIMDELIVAKSIIQKNIAAPGTVLALRFFESIMADSLKLETILDLTTKATSLVRRWAEKEVKPLDLLVVAAGLTLTYYLNKGLILSDRNLHYVMGNHLIRMVSYTGATAGSARRTIGSTVYRQIGAFLITVSRTGIDYIKRRDIEQAAMLGPLEQPDDEKHAE